MLDAIAQSTLPIGLFRFTLAPLQTLLVPAMTKGNMLRGGFGHTGQAAHLDGELVEESSPMKRGLKVDGSSLTLTRVLR